MTNTNVQYGDYLQLENILNAQFPESDKHQLPAPRRNAFSLSSTRRYELWFKQLLYEVDSVADIMNKPAVNDNSPELQTVVHCLAAHGYHPEAAGAPDRRDGNHDADGFPRFSRYACALRPDSRAGSSKRWKPGWACNTNSASGRSITFPSSSRIRSTLSAKSGKRKKYSLPC